MLVENLPQLIQGGMGVGVSNWRLARAVAVAGQEIGKPVLGVVSGTGIEVLMHRRLQDGDKDQKLAVEAFPLSQASNDILRRWYRTPRSVSLRYKPSPKLQDVMSKSQMRRDKMIDDSIVANFVEVWLAKQGHEGPIGINHLEKIQLLHPFRLYGAMLAGVDFVLEGAGIPRQVPAVLDGLSRGDKVSYNVNLVGSKEPLVIDFDPTEYWQKIEPDKLPPQLQRPLFLAIVSSNVLAEVLAKKTSGRVNGFVIEGPTAGGHNASPRGKFESNERGEPIYGDKDKVDLDKIASLGLPFWLAGSYGDPTKLGEALALGARGVQIGTIFALCKESGLTPELKSEILFNIRAGNQDILTSPRVSPTGFPFKTAVLEGTLTDPEVYAERVRRCSIGHLAQVYMAPNGRIGSRCAAEPVSLYVKKGGDASDTEGSVCICNGLIAAAGYPQKDKFGVEPSIITLGDDLTGAKILDQLRGGHPYSARNVLEYIFGNPTTN